MFNSNQKSIEMITLNDIANIAFQRVITLFSKDFLSTTKIMLQGLYELNNQYFYVTFFPFSYALVRISSLGLDVIEFGLMHHVAIENLIQIKNIQSLLTNSTYGFIHSNGLQQDNYRGHTIINAEQTDWLTTSDVSQFAKNHCAATAATNIIIYYGQRGMHQLMVNQNTVETFKKMHHRIGNGPVFKIDHKIKHYFREKGSSIRIQSINNFLDIKASVHQNYISSFLVANRIFNWHWILGIGFREYDDGNKYIQIVDGWNRSIHRYYKPHSGALWLSSSSYQTKT